MSRFWNPIVKTLTPYTPGQQPSHNDIITAKVNTNESPFAPSKKALEAMQAAINGDLRLYPDSESLPIRQAMSEHYGINDDQVFVGNGSDEVLAHTFQALFQSDNPILFPDISYSFYPVYSKLYQKKPRKIPLNKNFDINIADYHQKNGGIIFPNPNAPTGKLLPLSDIEQLLMTNTDSVVVIDEAYIDFGGESAVSLINSFEQLLVTQTVSKSRGLAGIRVGFAMGHRDLICALNRVKNSFNSYPIDSIAMAGATASIKDVDYFNETCQKIIMNRDYLTKELQAMNFEVIPSKANFLLVKPSQYNAEEIYHKLKTFGIMVRYFNLPRIHDYLRITIGNKAQCNLLLDALKQIVLGQG